MRNPDTSADVRVVVCRSASGREKFMDPVAGSAWGLAPSHHTTKPISTTSWEARFRPATKSALSNKCWLPSRDTTNRTSRRSYAPACLRDSRGSVPPLGSRRGTRTRDTGTAMAGRSGPPAGLSCQCVCVLRRAISWGLLLHLPLWACKSDYNSCLILLRLCARNCTLPSKRGCGGCKKSCGQRCVTGA
jgi:hypothetical protein